MYGDVTTHPCPSTNSMIKSGGIFNKKSQIFPLNWNKFTRETFPWFTCSQSHIGVNRGLFPSTHLLHKYRRCHGQRRLRTAEHNTVATWCGYQHSIVMKDDVISTPRAWPQILWAHGEIQWGYIRYPQDDRAPFSWRGLTLIPAWIRNYIHYKMWGEITYSFLNFNGPTVQF